jgi:hypothetical protein
MISLAMVPLRGKKRKEMRCSSASQMDLGTTTTMAKQAHRRRFFGLQRREGKIERASQKGRG